MFQAYTWQGTCHIIISGPAYRLDLWEYYSSPVPQQGDATGTSARSPALLGFSIQELSGVLHVTAPMWFMVAGFGAIALALCHNHIKRRFSLRTLLIATTLVAVVLGIIAMLS
jgi:phosphotransferase system  glucose/maltose/N-acetylglucosamine-specific IIC component